MITSFQDLQIAENLSVLVARLPFKTPTPIQAKAIPLALQGNDILGSAQTGTGKTIAFVIPLINQLMTTAQTTALVLVPTRELANQVYEVIHNLLGRRSNLNTALLIGGDSISKQLKQLSCNPRIVVGTPGRINDHLNRNSLRLENTSFLVLDETDRMLDMGFGIQIDAIVQHLPSVRQTLMFSATLPKNIIKASEKYLKNPQRVDVQPVKEAPLKIKEEFIHLDEDKKYLTLTEELEKRSGTVLLFVKTKRRAEMISKALQKAKHSASYIHGDLRQRQRELVIKKFRNYQTRIMVATDLAARGLDIPHIEHVINYDVPQCPEDYVHRIGRTGRAGAEGASLSLISPEDHYKWRELQRYLNPHKPLDKKKSPLKPTFTNGKKRSDDRPSYGMGEKSANTHGFQYASKKRVGKPTFKREA